MRPSAASAQIRAYHYGHERGVAAGSWVIDGNTSEETARNLLRGIDDGDPVVYDVLPFAPLSGEWPTDSPRPTCSTQSASLLTIRSQKTCSPRSRTATRQESKTRSCERRGRF